MRKLWKRLVSFTLAATMVVSMAACGGKEEKKQEPITLTVYSQLANYSGEQVGWFAKVLLDKFNVKLTIIPDYDGVYDTRMANGNLGDIVVWESSGSDYQNAVTADMLLDWEEDGLLDEYGSYIKENMSLALEIGRAHV